MFRPPAVAARGIPGIPNQLRFHLLFLVLAVLGAAPSLAQTESPLLGKTVFIRNPMPGQKVYVDLSGTGHLTTTAADHWVSFTFTSAVALPHMRNFFVRNEHGQGSWWMLRT